MTEDHTVVNDQISIRELMFSLRCWYRYIISKKKIILGYSAIGILVGLSYSLISNPIYVARTSFVLENTKKTSIGDYASLAAKFGFGSSGGGGLFQEDNNIIALLTSRTMVAKTLYTPVNDGHTNELLAHRYLKINNFDKKWSSNKQLKKLVFHVDPHERNRLEDSVVTFFCKMIVKKNLNVDKPDKEEGIIVVTTMASDEVFSKSFNENLLKNAVSNYISYQTQKSQENVDILQHQVDSVRYVLSSALTGVAISSEANPNPNPAFLRIKVPSQRKMVDVEMSKAMLEELVKNLELAKITLRKETPLIQTIDIPILPLEREQIKPLKGMIFGFLLSLLLIVIYYTLCYNFRQLLASTT